MLGQIQMEIPGRRGTLVKGWIPLVGSFALRPFTFLSA